MSEHPLLINGNEVLEFSKLRPIVDKCYHEIVNASLTYQETRSVIKYLNRKLENSILNSKVK